MAYKDAATEFWRCAYEYYNSNKSKDTYTMKKVIFYLIGLSLELYFKAFIILAEDTKEGYKKIKKRLRKIRHNLVLLYDEAKEKGLSILTEKERKLVCKLSKRYYSHSNFRYKQGVNINGVEIANLLQIELRPLRYYFSLMEKIRKEADRKIFA